jgi:toxin ParE1/3/4
VPHFLLTNAAKNDLVGIAKFTQQRWGVDQRDKYLAQLDDMFHQLANHPELGKTCDYIKRGYRKFPIASHVIYYRTFSNRIEIVRVLHKRMDISESIF